MKNAKTFLSFLNYLKSEFGHQTALSTHAEIGYSLISYNQLVDDSKHIAKFFINRRNTSDFKVAILAENNILWARYAFGALLADATLIPVDIALSAREVSKLLHHAGPDLIIYSNQQESLLNKAFEFDVPEIETFKMEDLYLIPLFEHVEIKETLPERNALIVYTSGSSGNPKGVMLSEEAIIFETLSIGEKLKIENSVALSMLPINHTFEFTAGLCANLSYGAEICIAKDLDIESLKRDFSQRKVNQMVTVPLFISKIKEGVERNVRNKGMLAKFVFKLAFKFAALFSSDKNRRFIFKFIHKNLAPNLIRFIAGGAKTPIKDLEFFDRLGILIYEGYGLTETAPVIATNSPGIHKLGSVGKALTGVEVRINKVVGPDFGEIQVRGKNVMMGYYKNEQLTKEVFTTDGWFKTGDIGTIDEEGFVKIDGRIKNLIVLEGGKKIHPEEIEELFNILPEIKDISVNAITAQVNGKSQIQIAYVLVPSDDLVTLHNNDWDLITESLNAIANDVMKHMAPYKKANKIFISKEELPKTSTRKIKQATVKDVLAELAKHSERESIYKVSKASELNKATYFNSPAQL